MKTLSHVNLTGPHGKRGWGMLPHPRPRLPVGGELFSIYIPVGEETSPFPSPNRGIPRGESGIGSPLPSLVRCTTGQSGVPGQSWCWLHIANSFPFLFFFCHCFLHLDKHISIQNNILSLETYLTLLFALFTHFAHKYSINVLGM